MMSWNEKTSSCLKQYSTSKCILCSYIESKLRKVFVLFFSLAISTLPWKEQHPHPPLLFFGGDIFLFFSVRLPQQSKKVQTLPKHGQQRHCSATRPCVVTQHDRVVSCGHQQAKKTHWACSLLESVTWLQTQQGLASLLCPPIKRCRSGAGCGLAAPG